MPMSSPSSSPIALLIASNSSELPSNAGDGMQHDIWRQFNASELHGQSVASNQLILQRYKPPKRIVTSFVVYVTCFEEVTQLEQVSGSKYRLGLWVGLG
mmetsp:Transcript_5273/g.6900  ORF Transcript_5273/g.6900 Transcript_5273/m.6900 type:complete len:99 (+) Transcript_5273:581-877(+)